MVTIEPIVVEKLATDLLLGTPFFKKNQAVIDFLKERVTIGGEAGDLSKIVVPMVWKQPKLKSLINCVILPGSRKEIPVSLDGTVNNLQVATHSKRNKILEGAWDNSCQTVKVLNESVEPKQIRIGETVAILETVDEINVNFSEINEEFLKELVEESKQESPNEGVDEVEINGLKFYLGNKLNKEEKENLIRLLTKYIGSFTEKTSELGKCTFAEHSVNTGNNPPFQERLRNIPFTQRPEVERIVQEMIDGGVARPSSSSIHHQE